MSKLEKLMAAGGANVSESIGRGVPSSPALIGNFTGQPERLKGIAKRTDLASIPVAKLAPDPEQPREEFDAGELDRLADSLKSHGQIQPIAAWWDESESVYRIAAGERRWRAARIAGLEALVVTILPARPEESRLRVLQLAENLHRDNLKPMEQAKTFRKIMDLNGWSATRLAREMSITDGMVSRTLALLTLPEQIRSQVEDGTLPGATAYVISRLDDPQSQAEVVARVVSEGLSRDETAEIVKRVSPEKKSGKKGRAARSIKPVVKTLRTPDGKITVELRKGLDPGMLEAVLLAGLAMLRGQGQEAA
jgi:ParB family chromosome partitioning protein